MGGETLQQAPHRPQPFTLIFVRSSLSPRALKISGQLDVS
jgi:hypothetical protein